MARLGIGIGLGEVKRFLKNDSQNSEQPRPRRRGRWVVSVLALAPAFAIAAAWLVPRLLDTPTVCRTDKTRADLAAYASALAMYWLERDAYPATLALLVEEELLGRLHSDAWGNAYQYSLQRPGIAPRDMPFYLWTLGKDGASGGVEENRDRGNWKPGRYD